MQEWYQCLTPSEVAGMSLQSCRDHGPRGNCELTPWILTGTVAGAFRLTALPNFSSASACKLLSPSWRRGTENQRLADLGNGTFLNPVLAGDYVNPTVLRDGDEYYMTNK